MEIGFVADLEQHEHGRSTILLLRVPAEESDLLNDLPVMRGGFRSIKVEAAIGRTTWRTSLFPSGLEFLLLVARRRAAAEKLEIGAPVEVLVTVL